MGNTGEHAKCGRPACHKGRLVAGIQCDSVLNGSTVNVGGGEGHLSLRYAASYCGLFSLFPAIYGIILEFPAELKPLP